MLNGIDRGLNVVDGIEIRRLGWVCDILRVEGERIPSGKKNSQLEIPQQIYSRKSKTRRKKAVQRVALQFLGITSWRR